MGEGINRRRFLQLGVAGVVGLAGGFGYPGSVGHRAYRRASRSVRVTDPEFGAKGDGRTDDAPAIRRALSDPTVKEVVFPKNPGYAVDMGKDGWASLPLRSGVRLVGHGAEGPLIRAGGFVNNRFMFENVHSPTVGEPEAIGDDGIKMHSLCILGRMQEVRLIELDDPDVPHNTATVNTAIAVRSLWAQGRSEGFELLGCRISDWPGVAVSCNNLADFAWRENVISRAHRGGLILHFSNVRGIVAGNVVVDVGDDAVGLNADGNDPVPEERGPSADVTIRDNVLSRVRDEARTPGPALAVRGGNDIRVENNRVLQSMGPAMYFEKRAGFGCNRLNVLHNHMQDCDEGALFAKPGVRGIASHNTSSGCSTPPRFTIYRNHSRDFVIDGTNEPRPVAET